MSELSKSESGSQTISSAKPDLAAYHARRNRFRTLRRLSHHKGALIGIAVLAFLVLTAISAPILSPYDPIETTGNTLQSPSRDHLFGTDNIGRDIFSRVVFGSRISLQMGLIAVAIGAGIGTVAGITAGMYGNWIDTILMRLIDALMAFPGILLALAIAAILGPGLTNAMIAVGIASIPIYARIVRSSVLQVKVTPYVEAARSIGCSDIRITTHHVTPNVLTPILVVATLGVAQAILVGASLSFLGLGAQPPTPEWGAILSQGRQFMRTAWWVMLFPGAAITLTVMAANLLGDGLRDALDPRLKI